MGITGRSWDIGTRESATVELLLALLEADELEPITPAELKPESSPPVGGVLVTFQDLPAAPSSAPSDAAPSSTPESVPDDEAAIFAAGPVDALLTAVARQLALMAADQTVGAAARVQYLHALRPLTPHLPDHVAQALASQLRQIHCDPHFSESDLATIASTGALNAMRINDGGVRLPVIALLTATELLAPGPARTHRAPDNDRANHARMAAAAAVPLLRDPDQQTRFMAALTIQAAAVTSDDCSCFVHGLICHPDPQVRRVGAQQVDLTPEVSDLLAGDPSPEVRAALAARTGHLPESVRTRLTQDINSLVRFQVNGRTSQDPN